MSPPSPHPKKKARKDWRAAAGHVPRALHLVWTTNRRLTLALGLLSLVAGVLPAVGAWIGKHIVDGVLAASRSGLQADRDAALLWLGAELAIMVGMAACQRGLDVVRNLLRAQLGHRVNFMILEKALTLDLQHFEDAEYYDKLTRSRREASVRPLALVQRTFQMAQNGLALTGYAGLLWQISPWAVLLLVITALPAFVAETKFSGEAFRLFRWRTPETRKQNYLEVVMTRLEYAKEVAIYGLGPRLLERYEAIYHELYEKDRDLTLRRNFWGLLLGYLSTLGFYAVYAWIAWRAMTGELTLGQMTMALMVFRQGQGSLTAMFTGVGGMYEDTLYLSTLHEYLEEVVSAPTGGATEGPEPGDGVRFEDVAFTYPGADRPALSGVTFHLPAGSKLALVGHNGSGKTTLIKLMARLYTPTRGRVLLDGRDLQEWDPMVLRRRIGVIFQDFAKYQFLAGENIGAGDVDAFEDEDRWRQAAALGMADEVIDELPDGYETQLGRWFKDGRELSGGQWQKVALSRAFMRSDADILVLDEPTAAMDAEAELAIFEHVRKVSAEKIAILISHRFSTVRMADRIIVLDAGQVLEDGTHQELMAADRTYARLFTLQARAFVEHEEARLRPGTAGS